MGGSKKWLRTLIGIPNSDKNSSSRRHDDQERVQSDTPQLWNRKKSSRPKRSFYRERFEAYGKQKEEKAAICIQRQFRGYLARKSLQNLKGAVRLKALLQDIDTKKQALSALSSMQYWIRLQTHIKSRRLCMVTAARMKEKQREHQMKLEAEIHGLETDWLDGSETMEEIVARVHHREEAALKRERALAYAFSHQWRPTSKINRYAGYEFDNTSWGWSWLERWIAARPWENRLMSHGKDGVKQVFSETLKNVHSNSNISSMKNNLSKTKSNGVTNNKDFVNGVGTLVKKHPPPSNCEKQAIESKHVNELESNMNKVVESPILAS
eukprot:TRINITY_DN7216_c0_g1_i1.p1 TRINITY_DN7216_c0_g1~~TRINITY_DN7216_c0_g1_i1.p1  ORF type:complete len:324 (+),score=73.32 TRINITY_DN7216_c0_g1_i1:170-1141(+)